MRLINVHDGFTTVEIHWTEARIIAGALDGVVCRDLIEDVDINWLTTIASAFEAMTLAGNLQLLSVEAERTTLERFRETGGKRDRARGMPDATPDDQAVA